MDIYIGIFFIYLTILVRTFLGKNKIYAFYRNIIYARGIAFILIAILFFLIIINFTLLIIGNDTDILKDTIIPIMLIIFIAVSTIVEHKLHGEGVYKEGILIKGAFYAWSKVIDSKITKKPCSELLIWTIYLYAIGNMVATRTITISKQQASKIEEEIKNFLVNRDIDIEKP